MKKEKRKNFTDSMPLYIANLIFSARKYQIEEKYLNSENFFYIIVIDIKRIFYSVNKKDLLFLIKIFLISRFKITKLEELEIKKIINLLYK